MHNILKPISKYFKENQFFEDRVLKKEYKFIVPPVDEKPDADGVTESMLDFSWERDVKPSVSYSVRCLTTTSELNTICRPQK